MIDQYHSLSEKFLKKGFWLYLFAFIVGPLGYITRILLSDTLSVSEVGIIYGVISLITLVAAFNDFGVSESVKYYLPKYIAEKDYSKVKSLLIYGLIVQGVTGLVLTLFFYFGAEFLALYQLKSEAAVGVVQIFALYFLGLNIFQLLSNFFLAVQNTFLVKILELVRNLGIVLLTVFFIFSGTSDVVNFSWAWIVGLYSAIFLGVVVFYKKYFHYLHSETIIWNKSHIFPILQYALLIFLGAQSSTILSQMDMQMLLFFKGAEAGGYYTNYLSIIGIPFLVIGPIFVLLFPIISELDAKNDRKSILLVKSLFTKIFFAIGVFIALFFLVYGEQIAYILFGEKFISSGVILKYASIFLIFNFLLQINFNIIAGTGKARLRFYIILIAILVNFFMNLILIQLLGGAGAALATGIGWIVIYVLGEVFLGKNYRTSFDLVGAIKNICVFSAVAGVSYYFLNISTDSRLQTFFIIFGIGLVWALVFAVINKSMMLQFVGEIKKLKRKKSP